LTDLKPVSQLDDLDQQLVGMALEVQSKAYAPYSRFLVGCAVRDKVGKVHVGCNVENASYSAVICAERAALFSMVAQGQTDCQTIVLVTSADEPCFPCGMCLQVIQELGRGARVIAVDKQGKFYRESTLKELFPSAFSVEKLNG